MKVTLPNGLLDGQDLFNVAIIGELTGKQQDYLVDRKLVEGNIGHIPKILEDMVISLETKEGLQWRGQIKDAIQKIPSSDLVTLMVKIRENTFGPKYYFESRCPHCDHKNRNLRLDLDKLKITKYPIKKMQDDAHRTVKLPKSEKTVVFKALYMKDLFTAVKIATKEEERLLSSSIALAIESIDGDKKVDAESVRSLPLMDIKFLQEKLEEVKLEGEIDIDIDNNCEECKKDFSQQLNVYDPDFFSLTRGFKSTNT